MDFSKAMNFEANVWKTCFPCNSVVFRQAFEVGGFSLQVTELLQQDLARHLNPVKIGRACMSAGLIDSQDFKEISDTRRDVTDGSQIDRLLHMLRHTGEDGYVKFKHILSANSEWRPLHRYGVLLQKMEAAEKQMMPTRRLQEDSGNLQSFV